MADDNINFDESFNMTLRAIHEAHEHRKGVEQQQMVKEVVLEASKDLKALNNFVHSHKNKLESDDYSRARELIKDLTRAIDNDLHRLDIGLIEGLGKQAEEMLKDFKAKY